MLGRGTLWRPILLLRPQTEAELKQAVEHHLDWYNSRSGFLSMFIASWHCWNLASQQGDAGVYIIKVDVIKLNHLYVFQAKHVILELGIVDHLNMSILSYIVYLAML